MPAHGEGGVGGGGHIRGTQAVAGLKRQIYTHAWKYLLRLEEQTPLKEAGAHTGCGLQPSGIPHTSLHLSIHPSIHPGGERGKK